MFRASIPKISRLAKTSVSQLAVPSRGIKRSVPISTMFVRNISPWRRSVIYEFPIQMRAMEKHFRDIIERFPLYSRPPWNRFDNDRYGQEMKQVKYDSKDFQVSLHVEHYTPEEIQIKLVDNKMTITGKHHDKQDEYGFISREFTRQFILPAEIDFDTLTSSLSNDGTLMIQAKVKRPAERIIDIQKETPEVKKPEPAQESQDELKTEHVK